MIIDLKSSPSFTSKTCRNKTHFLNWGAWDTICRHKAKDITPLITCGRSQGIKTESLSWSSFKEWERAITNQIITGSVSNYGNIGGIFWETGWSACGSLYHTKYKQAVPSQTKMNPVLDGHLTARNEPISPQICSSTALPISPPPPPPPSLSLCDCAKRNNHFTVLRVCSLVKSDIKRHDINTCVHVLTTAHYSKTKALNYDSVVNKEITFLTIRFLLQILKVNIGLTDTHTPPQERWCVCETYVYLQDLKQKSYG